jgi:hypothetical protein
MVEAVKVAAYLNIEFLEAYRAADRGGEDGLTPCCFASPAVWPYDPELHERALKEQQAQAAQCKPLHWLSSVA